MPKNPKRDLKFGQVRAWLVLQREHKLIDVKIHQIKQSQARAETDCNLKEIAGNCVIMYEKLKIGHLGNNGLSWKVIFISSRYLE